MMDCIRLAKRWEINDCVSLSKASWPDWWNENEKAGTNHIIECVKNKRCLVAFVNEQVIWFCVWWNLWNKIHLQDIFVEPLYRKHKLATKLLEKMIQISSKKWIKEVLSDTDTINQIAIDFHIKNGFVKVGFIEKNWDEDDSYVFVRKI